MPGVEITWEEMLDNDGFFEEDDRDDDERKLTRERVTKAEVDLLNKLFEGVQVRLDDEAEPRRWTIFVCSRCGLQDPADCSRDFDCAYSMGEEVEVIEARKTKPQWVRH